jgi:hypothetical protein
MQKRFIESAWHALKPGGQLFVHGEHVILPGVPADNLPFLDEIPESHFKVLGYRGEGFRDGKLMVDAFHLQKRAAEST